MLAAEIPFKAQETLKLSNNLPTKISGSLASRLSASLNFKERQAFGLFFTQWKKLITLIERNNQSCLLKGKNCPFSSPNWKVQNSQKKKDVFSLVLDLKRDYRVHFDSTALQKTFFSHQKIILKNFKNSERKDVFKIEFFYQRCKKS